MMRHPALALIVAALLAVATALGGPVHAGAGGRMVVLCTGDGPVRVTLDAGGRPTLPDRHCTACPVAGEAPLPQAPRPAWTPAPRPLPPGLDGGPVALPVTFIARQARAPPLQV